MTQHYVGTKIVKAWPQDRSEIIASVSQPRAGYAVQYEDGYTSWTPAKQFEEAYLPLGHLDNEPAFLQRLRGERAQLDDRRQKLADFLKRTDTPDFSFRERLCMRQQLVAMDAYSACLTERINAHDREVNRA